MTLGERLRELRKDGNMKLRHVSEMSELSVPYLSDIERDVVNPSILSLARIAKIYGMPLSVLLYKVEIDISDTQTDEQSLQRS